MVQEGVEMIWQLVGLVCKEILEKAGITWLSYVENRRNRRRRDNHVLPKGYEL